MSKEKEEARFIGSQWKSMKDGRGKEIGHEERRKKGIIRRAYAECKCKIMEA